MTQIQAYALGYMYRQLEDLTTQQFGDKTRAENLDAAARRPIQSMAKIQGALLETQNMPPHVIAALYKLYQFLGSEAEMPAREAALQDALSWSWLLGYCGCRCALYDEACGMLYGRCD
jgi:hypothetical protein